MKLTSTLLFCFLMISDAKAQDIHKPGSEPKSITESQFNAAMQVFESQEVLPEEELNTAISTGQRYLMQQRNNEGMVELFEKAAAYAKRTNQEKEYIDLKSNLAQTLISLGQSQKGITIIEELLANYDITPSLAARFYKALGDGYGELDDFDTAQKSLFKALENANEAQDTFFIGMSYISLATLNQSKGNVYDAIDYNIQGLNVLDAENHAYLIAGACQILCAIFQDLGNYEKAQEYADRLDDICERKGYRQLSSYAKASLGKQAEIRDDYTAALAFYQQAIDGIENSGVRIHGAHDMRTAVRLKLSCAKIHQKMGNYDKANSILELISNEDIADLKTKDKMLYYEARIASAIQSGDGNEMRDFMRVAELEIGENPSFSIRRRVAGMKKDVAEKNKDYKTANEQLSIAYAMKDSMEANNRAQLVHNLEAKYQKAEQEKEISKLSFQNELTNSELKRKNIWLLVGGLGIIMLSFFVFQLYRLYQSNKQNKEKLAKQNLVIHKALEDKNTLLKEIHHRVKNNLQVISSLLNLQSRYIKDEETLDAIKAGKSRVQSMSLLHQNLYRDDNLKGVEMNQYFQNLGQNLFDTYNIEDSIQFTTDIDQMTLDIDTVVPMGLITNELISNALKHAFKGRDTGKIHLSLKEKENKLYLTVKDNGVGLPDGELPVSYKSLGATLIQSFTEKLEGKVIIDISEGSSVTIEINDYNKVA